ncbi:MAG: hypothetical protein EA359_02645 [Balneolaceae bacterium]|nr:MAG: hypothetical protein EA359_02645 [Balneolaceae bacterium]
MVGILIFAGIIDLEEFIGNIDIIYIIAVLAIATVLIILIVQFQRYLFDLPLKHSSIIFSFYLVRFLIHHTLLIIQLAVVIPDTSLNVWFTFLAVIIIVNRIPFLPGRDLIFMWAGIELSRSLYMATPSVAGMLLVSSALKK